MVSPVVQKLPLKRYHQYDCMTLLSHFRLDDINCIDKPAEFYPPGTPVQRFLPGDIATTHKQCQDRGYDWACAVSSTRLFIVVFFF